MEKAKLNSAGEMIIMREVDNKEQWFRARCSLKQNGGMCDISCPMLTRAMGRIATETDPVFGVVSYEETPVFRLMCGCQPVEYEIYPGPRETAMYAAKKLE